MTSISSLYSGILYTCGVSYSKQARTCRSVNDTTDKYTPRSKTILEQNFKVRCIQNIQTVLSENR